MTCEELDIKYRPDPIADPSHKRDVQFPEDRLKAGMKERIVATVVGSHERCEAEVEKRLKYEDKIKRTYFHVKPLDVKQLKNWDAYLDFEMEEGNHERIVVLFERCLIPCAPYEQFWGKYARFEP
jgi:pre-mRNA-processing factor 39